MPKPTRIADWGLADRVEWLIESGMNDDRAIAAKLNEDPEVAVRIKRAKVMPIDIRNYMQQRIEKKDKALEKSLAHSPQSHVILDQARAATGRFLEMVTLFEGIVPDVAEDLDTMKDRWREAQKAIEDGSARDNDYLVPYYGEQVKALKDVVGILDTIISRAESPGIQAIVRANTHNENVNVGMSTDDIVKRLLAMAKNLRCPHCGQREFTERELLGAWGRAQGDVAEDEVLDAERA